MKKIISRTFLFCLFALNLSTVFAQIQTGRSLHFDGVNDYISGIPLPLSGAPDHTIEFYVKNEGSPNNSRVFDFGQDNFTGSATDYYVAFIPNNPNGQAQLKYQFGAGSLNLYAPALTNTWTHVAIVFDGIVATSNAIATIYYDGVQQASGSSFQIDAIGPDLNYFGLSQENLHPHFNGYLDDIRIWNDVRTSTEIMDWKDCELSGTEDNLVSYFKLNQGIDNAQNPNTGDYNPFYFPVQNTGDGFTAPGHAHNFSMSGTQSNWSAMSGISDSPSENNCIEFDGLENYDFFTLVNEQNFDFADEYTIEFWYNYNEDSYNLPVIKGNQTYGINYFIDQTGNFLNHGNKIAGTQDYQVINDFTPDDTWHHVAAVGYQTGSSLRRELYVDGELKNTKDFPFFHPTFRVINDPVLIGLNTDGKMSNIKFWDKRRTASDIKENMSNVFPSGTPGLVAQYVQFQDINQGLLDSIGGNNGTRNGSPTFASDPCFVLFNQQPEDYMLPANNSSVTFSASFLKCSDKNYSYQWLKDGNPISGETNLSYTISSATVADLGQYSLDVMACGKIFTTRKANLSIVNQGNVLHFDGKDDYVKWDGGLAAGDYTIETFVKFDTDPKNQTIITMSNANGLADLASHQIVVNKDGKFQHNSYSGGMRTVVHDQPLIANTWYHVAASVSGGFLRLFVDGVPATEAFNMVNMPTPIAGTTFYIGHAACGFDYFNGEIDELRIWNTMTNTMNLPAVAPTEIGLEYYYNFNEGLANLANDNPAINTIADLKVGSSIVADLFNFTLDGNRSNWLGCGPFSNDIIINTHPQNVSLIEGEKLTLTVESSNNNGTETYAWYYNDVLLPSQTNASLEINQIQALEAGTYYAIVNRLNSCPQVSDPAIVLVRGTGQVLNFDGIDDYMAIEDLFTTDPYTIEVWVKFDGSVANKNIIQGTDDRGPLIYAQSQLYTDANGVITHYAYNDFDGHRTQPSTVTAELDRWYHIAIRNEEGTGLEILVDGVEVQAGNVSFNQSPSNSTTRYFVGARGHTYQNGNYVILDNFQGEIDDLRIWRSFRTNTEILDNLNNEINTIIPGISDLQGYYKFNRGDANDDNTFLNEGDIPNYKSITNYEYDNTAIYNFSLTGSESNYSDCSPVQKPVLNPGNQPLGNFLNSNVNLEVFDIKNNSGLSYQWLFNGTNISNETNYNLPIDDFDISDIGEYGVEVKDVCSPQFIDTLFFPIDTVCFGDPGIFMHTDIDYPTTSIYTQDSIESFNFSNLKGPWCGNDIEYNGSVALFKWTIEDPSFVKFTLSNLGAEADLIILGDDCSSTSCLGSSLNPGFQNEYLQLDFDSGDYYILVAGFDEQIFSYNFNLEVELLDSKCLNATPINCGETVSGTTAGSDKYIEEYCGTTNNYFGSEKIYSITLTEAQTLSINLSNLDEDLDLFLMDSLCLDVVCLGSSTSNDLLDESIVYGANPGTYYIAVDGKDGVTGNFDLSLNCQSFFSASVLDNDAYIELNWAIDKKLCVPQDTGVIVRLIAAPNEILFEETFNTAASTPDIISGNYLDYVGVSQTKSYVLRVYNRLSNEAICDEIKVGSTTAFSPPEIVSISQAIHPDSIEIIWRNHSKLSDIFSIYRDGSLLATLNDGFTQDSLIITYVDGHNINDINSIQTNSSYNYCIETFSTNLNSAYPQICDTGSTMDLNFTASDLTFGDSIQLNWADISSFCSSIKIERNGILLANLDSTETSFIDTSPLYGLDIMYSLTIMRGPVEVMEVFDLGSVAAHGEIAGQITTLEGGYPLRDITVTLSKDTLVDGSLELTQIASTISNFEGKYDFNEVVYGLETTFTVMADNVDLNFDNPTRLTTLNQAIPVDLNVNFIDTTSVNSTISSTLIDTFIGMAMVSEDLVDLSWNYTYNANDTIYFKIYREGDVIFETNDASGKVDAFVDSTGVPGLLYTYTLEAFRFDPSTVTNHTLSVDVEFPVQTPLIDFDVVTGNSANPDPRLYFTWGTTPHPSLNYDGYRIFQNGNLIGEVDKNTNEFTFIAIPDSLAGYSIKTFRNTPDASFESAPYPLNDTLVRSGPLFLPSLDVALTNSGSKRNIFIESSVASGNSTFFEQGFYDGILYERKLHSQADSSYEIIGDVTKAFAASQIDGQIGIVFYDETGIPDSLYDFRISVYLEVNGEVHRNGFVDTRTCPTVVSPSNIIAIEEIGKVGFTWNDESTLSNQISLRNINYHGIEVFRRDVTNNTNFESIAELPKNAKSYNDYISNPVFNIFYNQYETIQYEYAVRSYLTINDERYYSPLQAISAKPLSGSTEEPIPTNFIASEDISGHIKLCWEWLPAKQSEFIIYRDSIALDTLPFTARAFYDYDAPNDPVVPYFIESYFDGNTSEKAGAEGRMASFVNITGRVYNQIDGSGKEGVILYYKNESSAGISEDTYTDYASTDLNGRYTFNDVPNINGLDLLIIASGDNVDFNSDTLLYEVTDSLVLTIDTSDTYTMDFIDYQGSDSTDALATIRSVITKSNSKEFYVNIEWSPSDANYQGVEVFRANKRLATIPKGEIFSLIDSTGFAGISYGYGVKTYRDVNGVREYSELVTDDTVFPSLLPVDNLTATGIFKENKMLIAWSHPYDNHDYYRLRRNGEFLALIPTGDKMMFCDTTGVPGQNYQYEVIAINGNSISSPNVIISRFKGVGEVENLQVSIDNSIQACSFATTNANHVRVSWEYVPNSAQGFEIYRDNTLIAEIDSIDLAYGNLPLLPGDNLMNGRNAYYLDYSGAPGENHDYHVLAYVERNDVRYFSGIEELFPIQTIAFPELAEVNTLNIMQNNVLGSIQIGFNYDPFIATGFEIIRDGIVIDTILDTNVGSYEFQDFDGLPGQIYNYAVRAFDIRNGQVYFSSTVCEETIEFPIVPVPQNFSASEGDFLNHIEVRWDFSTQAFVDSFYVENLTLNTTTLYTNGERIHTDVVDDFQFETYLYRIRASRILNGTTIYSEWSENVEGWSQKQENGSDDELFDENCFTNNLGHAVAIDGDWAVATTSGSSESFEIYRRQKGGWSVYEIIESQNTIPTDFGHSVAISGERILIGSPGSNEVFLYEFDGSSWEYPIRIPNTTNSFGWAVDIDGDNIIIGAPEMDETTPIGKAFFYKIENDLINFIVERVGPVASRRFGYGVAISGDQAVVSYHHNNLNQENTFFLRNDSGCPDPWGCGTRDGAWDQTIEDSYVYRDNVDLDGNKLITSYSRGSLIGSSFPIIRVGELTQGVLSNISTLNVPLDDGFDIAVSIAEIPAPINNVTYALVSNYNRTINGVLQAGRSHLFSDMTGSFQEIEIIEADVIDAGDKFGFSVGLSNDALIIGAIGDGSLDQGAVKIKNFIEAPTLVTATDGISTDNDPTETTVYWEYEGDEDLIGGFNIYRGDEFLTFRNFATMSIVAPGVYGGSWNDNSGNAGERYVYSVHSANTISGFESPGTSDEGYNQPDGKIQGSVVTAQGGIAVPGVSITAIGIVNNEVFTYETTTFADGQYIINNVYYDSDPSIATTYTVTAALSTNLILPIGSAETTLNSLNQPVTGIVNFVDNTAFVIAGQVTQDMVNCAVEGIKITPVINGVPDIFSEATTDEDGKYSIVFDPNQSGLSQLNIRINNELTQELETFNYGFVATSDTVFTNFVNFPQETIIDFVDELTYPISLKVKNTCNDAISASRWDIRVRTLDGCFDEVFQTNLNGDLVADLYPLNYMLSVVGSDVTSSQNSKALDYFANFPVTLNLEELHRDSFDVMTNQEIADMSARQFTYHVAADIGINGFDEYFCNSPAAVIQQNESYTLTFDIEELHNSTYCPVQEGKIRINNPASRDDLNTVLVYDDLLEEFPEYTFTAGIPNQQSPHFYAITVDYLSLDNVFLGRKVIGAFVEGAVRLPGADIIVDPSSGNEAIPYPVMILRDPPGDQSSSYISGGQSISYTTAFEESLGGSANIYTNIGVEILGQNTTLGASFTAGGSSDYQREFTSELTVSQTIQTSNSPDAIGEQADIIIGTGLVTTFGIIQDYSIQNCDEILVQNIYNISADAATTTWSYTVAQIEDIIQGYKNDSIKLERGELVIADLTVNEAREKISTFIDNWREVLVFHRTTTRPHHAICSTDPDINSSLFNIESVQQSQIDTWQDKLCPLLGTGSDETFVVNEDLVWSDQIMDMYNAASISIRNIANGNNTSGIYTYPSDDNISAILNHPDVAAYIGAFGAPVKNITTGGQITINESFANVNSSSRSQASSFFIDSELSVAVKSENELTTVVGGFAGVGLGAIVGVFGGVIVTASSATFEAGLKANFNMKRTNTSASAQQNSVETGYTILDDDSEDAFSIAVIQPISQNQTAYFEYFGGHSSCPFEEGSFSVDNPLMQFYDSITDATSPTKELNNVQSDGSALFDIIIENGTNIASQPERELLISLDASTNDNGAVVKLNNVDLSNGDFLITLPAKTSDILTLDISRPLNSPFFEFRDLKLNIAPSCGGEPEQSILATAIFSNPCTPVTLVGPDENWVINDDTTKVQIIMQDYDTTNVSFVDATVQYRRIGAGEPWTDIDPRQLELGNFIKKDTLAVYNREFLPGQIPKYFFTWTIPLTEGAFPDGVYEVRVFMQCNNFTQTISNVISGRIARNGLKLFGTPEPADKLWTSGDEISFTFNKNIDCALLTSSFIDDNIFVTNETTGDTLDFNVSCYANKLIFSSVDPMATYDGQFLKVSVNRIPSLVGNISEQHDWSFRVVTQNIYWASADTVKIRLYQDETITITERIESNSAVEQLGLSLIAADNVLDSWLTILSPNVNGFSVTPVGADVSFQITASEAIGTYSETINIGGLTGSGNTPQLHLELEILVRPPNWIVNPNDFDNNMLMVSNWRYTTDEESSKSDDVADLISVWMDGEVRGVAPITKSGIFYASYLTIYGNDDDPDNSLLEFRIWDADTGTEYNGYPSDSIFYNQNSIRGTTSNPEMLVVDSLSDLARYIYLNDGWTGFSLFTNTDNMSTDHKLRSLKNVTEGDIIITNDKFAIYSDSLSWFNFGNANLQELDVNEGYMIYLENGPDTLRVTGTIVETPDNITLDNGWNWIGFPFEQSEDINQVLKLNSGNQDPDDLIKLDFPLQGEIFKFAQYDILNDNWNDGNIINLESNNLYKIFSGNLNGAVLEWNPQNNIAGPPSNVLKSVGIIADPNDANTWTDPTFNTDLVMPIIAEVILDSTIITNANDKIAIFENDTIRGFGEIDFVPSTGLYTLSCVVEKSAGNFDFRYYDATANTIYQSNNVLSFDINGVGQITDPYEIIFTSCPDHLVLSVANGPLNGLYEARLSITINGPIGINTLDSVILNAPEILLNNLDIDLGAMFETLQTGCGN